MYNIYVFLSELQRQKSDDSLLPIRSFADYCSIKLQCPNYYNRVSLLYLKCESYLKMSHCRSVVALLFDVLSQKVMRVTLTNP